MEKCTLTLLITLPSWGKKIQLTFSLHHQGWCFFYYPLFNHPYPINNFLRITPSITLPQLAVFFWCEFFPKCKKLKLKEMVLSKYSLFLEIFFSNFGKQFRIFFATFGFSFYFSSIFVTSF